MLDYQQRRIEAGANDFMAKPLEVETALSLVVVWIPPSMTETYKKIGKIRPWLLKEAPYVRNGSPQLYGEAGQTIPETSL